MLEHFSDVNEEDIFFALYEVDDGMNDRLLRHISRILGYDIEVNNRLKTYSEIGDFTKNTIIIAPRFLSEDILELAEEKDVCVYVVPE